MTPDPSPISKNNKGPFLFFFMNANVRSTNFSVSSLGIKTGL